MNELHLTSGDVFSITLVALGLIVSLVGCIKNNVSLKFSENSVLDKCIYVVPFINLILLTKTVFRHWLEANGLGGVSIAIDLLAMLAYGAVIGFMLGYASGIKYTTEEMEKELDKYLDKYLAELSEEE